MNETTTGIDKRPSLLTSPLQHILSKAVEALDRDYDKADLNHEVSTKTDWALAFSPIPLLGDKKMFGSIYRTLRNKDKYRNRGKEDLEQTRANAHFNAILARGCLYFVYAPLIKTVTEMILR